MLFFLFYVFFFFFQAEDGIRDHCVTGVQTCALPIWNFLNRPFVQKIFHALRVHPGNKFFSDLAVKVGELTEVNVLWAAAGTMVYSLFSLVEGFGLIFRASWACWMAIGESAFFVPIEFYELVRKPRFSWSIFIVMIINILMVWYLFANRHRLFRHHHHDDR